MPKAGQNPEIDFRVPLLTLPQYEGKHYEASVPDTLDLADMAKRLINAMVEPTDPQCNHEIYWLAVFGSKPVHMRHQFSDLVQFQILANLPRMRMISGSRQGLDVEKAVLEGMFRFIGPDGLYYNDPVSRPWCGEHDQSVPPSDALNASQPFVSVLQSAIMLHALLCYGQAAGDAIYTETALRCAESLIPLAVQEGGIAYYPKWNYVRGEGYSYAPAHENSYRRLADWVPALALLQCYDLTGHKPSLELARKLYRGIAEASLLDWLGKDGESLINWPEEESTYSGFPVMSSILPLEFGLRLGDRPLVETARAAFEKYLPFVEKWTGYFSELIFHGEKVSKMHTAESCFMAWAIENAVMLSVAGAGDYWDDADRWVRNQFTEAQLKEGEWVGRMLEEASTGKLPPHASTEKVVERNMGSFAGFMLFNDWFGGYDHSVADTLGGAAIQHCCTARSAVAIFEVWQHMIRWDGERLQVNLLLNRASEEADIDSHLPYAGRIDVRVKKPLALSVRIPEWVRPGEVRVTVDGKDRPVAVSGRYADVGPLAAGEVATMSFPIGEREETAVVHGRRYALRIKGSTVISVDPQGQYCPAYRREYYRKNEAPYRTVNRFVATPLKFKENHALAI